MTATTLYAPVSECGFHAEGAHIVGYAAPAAGRAPCLLKLVADGSPVAFARATRFSDEAEREAIRFGWCGARIDGLAMAGAIAARAEVRCGVTDRLLWSHALTAPIPQPRPLAEPLTVFAIMALSQECDASPGTAPLRPFLHNHLATLGKASFIHAVYRTFLKRDPEDGAIGFWSTLSEQDLVDGFVDNVFVSEEYRALPAQLIPGPFHPQFYFDLAPLD